MLLTGLGGWWVWQGRIRGRLIEIERAEPIAIDTRIDINTADWPELCLMPGTAKHWHAVVDDRAENRPFAISTSCGGSRHGPVTLEDETLSAADADLDATAEGIWRYGGD
jgi:hypothetical protein